MRKMVDIINALNNGANLIYVSGRFGGYVLNYENQSYDIRSDYARKIINRMKLCSKYENKRMVYKIK